LLGIAVFANGDGVAYPGRAALCEVLQLQSPGSVTRRVERLANKGYIKLSRERSTGGRWTHTVYTLTEKALTVSYKRDVATMTQPCSTSAPTVSDRCTQPDPTDATLRTNEEPEEDLEESFLPRHEYNEQLSKHVRDSWRDENGNPLPTPTDELEENPAGKQAVHDNGAADANGASNYEPEAV
jgi:hypothetical protein